MNGIGDVYDTDELGVYDAAMEDMGEGPVVVFPESDLMGMGQTGADFIRRLPRVRKLPHKKYLYPKFKHPGRVRAAALREQITDYLYDTIRQGDFGTGTSFKVFTNVGGKTLEFTNLETNGQLPWQEAFKVLGIVAVPTPPQIDSIAEKAQVELMTMGSWELFIGTNKRVKIGTFQKKFWNANPSKSGKPLRKCEAIPSQAPYGEGVEARRRIPFNMGNERVQTANILN